MDIIDALILGIVQGLAEYLPVSSSGHLEIFRQILGIDLGGAQNLEFDVALHVATVLSTIVILWHQFWPLCRSFFTFRRDDNFYYVLKILVSCIPIGIVGMFFKETVENVFGQGLGLVGCCLLVTAMLLAFSYFFRTTSVGGVRVPVSGDSGRSITFTDAFVIGCAQAVAVLPGLSRSGTTIATGLIIGNRRDQVAYFSFLMVIIPILGEAMLDIAKIFSHEVTETAIAAPGVGFAAMATGFIAAFAVGCMACKWMIDIVKKGKLIWFALYCAIVGAICLIKAFV